MRRRVGLAEFDEALGLLAEVSPDPPRGGVRQALDPDEAHVVPHEQRDLVGLLGRESQPLHDLPRHGRAFGVVAVERRFPRLLFPARWLCDVVEERGEPQREVARVGVADDGERVAPDVHVVVWPLVHSDAFAELRRDVSHQAQVHEVGEALLPVGEQEHLCDSRRGPSLR